ncbi:MAG: hypothetical protein ACRD3S_03355, partial [Terracidiphilus sp.]
PSPNSDIFSKASLAKITICCEIKQLSCGTTVVDERAKLISWYPCWASYWFWSFNCFALAVTWSWKTWRFGNNSRSSAADDLSRAFLDPIGCSGFCSGYSGGDGSRR